MKKVSLLLVFISNLFAQVDYSSQIQPIFDNSCTSCHGNSGGLNLSSYDYLMSNNVIVAGDHSNSELMEFTVTFAYDKWMYKEIVE